MVTSTLTKWFRTHAQEASTQTAKAHAHVAHPSEDKEGSVGNLRRIASLAAALALAITMAGSAFAAEPQRDAARLTADVAAAKDQKAAFAALSHAEQQAVIDYTSVASISSWHTLRRVPDRSGKVQAAAGAAVVKCWDWTWGRDAHNPVGVLLWQFTQRIQWCANGTKITNNPFRTPKGVPKFIWWSYNGLVGSEVGGGINQSTYRSFVEGWMAYRPPMPFLNQDNYPWLDMTAHADGRGTGSGGG